MALLELYRPNSLLLPEASAAQKVYPLLSTVPRHNRERLDVSTLFFDIFLQPSTNRIVAIGPELLNLNQELFPMRMIQNGRILHYEVTQIKGTTFFTTENLGESPSKPFEVTFEFNTFSETVSIDPLLNNYFSKFSRECRLSITTLQKDNPVEWITDWLNWHFRSYGVNRFVLYDNGSECREELIEVLKNVSLDMKIIFVDWPFPYGTDPYMFCQRGALNHCRLQFPVERGYCINLDLDEYLICSKNINLLAFLDKQLKHPAPGAVFIQQVIIPNIGSKKKSSLPRCWEFEYRHFIPGYQGEGKVWNKYGRTKYIFSYENVGYNAIHVTDSIKNPEYRKMFSLWRIIALQVKKLLWESTKLIHRFHIPKPRIDAIYPKWSDMCFFHFWGLDSGNRTNNVHRPMIDYDSEIHVPDTRISEIGSTIREIKSADGFSQANVGAIE